MGLFKKTTKPSQQAYAVVTGAGSGIGHSPARFPAPAWPPRRRSRHWPSSRRHARDGPCPIAFAAIPVPFPIRLRRTR